jgi:branched-subunit amino acid transport protein
MTKVLFAVALMAIVTYVPRVFPIAIFRQKIKSRFFKSFLYYIPYAVLGAMTFPAIIFSTSDLYFSLIGMVVALILAYFEQGLMKVAMGAVLVVYVCELLFLK